MAYWCAVHIQASRERLALHCLSKVNGFEVYSPRIKASRPRREDVTRPLFPGYCFVFIVLQWHAARWSPGVIRIVLDGTGPAKVPDRIIAELRARERGGVVQLPGAPGMKTGDRVRVTRGPLVGLGGLYAGQAPHERVAVLLTLLGGQTRVVLPRGDIEGDWLGSPGDGQPSLLVRHQSSARSQLGLLPNRHPPDARSRAGAAKTTRCGTPT
jgi:transcriptional antiterminator RfaH